MTTLKTLALAAFLVVGVTSNAFAYQVTGPVLELTDSKIVVQKGKEKWEMNRTGSTQIPVETKVGDKVTVEYSMTADKVDVKSAAKAEMKKEEKKAAPVAATHAATPATTAPVPVKAPHPAKAAPAAAPAPAAAH